MEFVASVGLVWLWVSSVAAAAGPHLLTDWVADWQLASWPWCSEQVSIRKQLRGALAPGVWARGLFLLAEFKVERSCSPFFFFSLLSLEWFDSISRVFCCTTHWWWARRLPALSFEKEDLLTSSLFLIYGFFLQSSSSFEFEGTFFYAASFYSSLECCSSALSLSSWHELANYRRIHSCRHTHTANSADLLLPLCFWELCTAIFSAASSLLLLSSLEQRCVLSFRKERRKEREGTDLLSQEDWSSSFLIGEWQKTERKLTKEQKWAKSLAWWQSLFCVFSDFFDIFPSWGASPFSWNSTVACAKSFLIGTNPPFVLWLLFTYQQ